MQSTANRPIYATALVLFAVLTTGLGRANGQALSVSPLKLQFNYVNGNPPGPQNVSILNAGSGTLQWSASADKSWILLSPSSGTGTALQVSVNPAGLAPTSYTGRITVTAPGATGSPQTITVTLSVPSPRLQLSTKVVSISTDSSGQGSASISLTNTGGGTLNWTAVSNNSWLEISPAAGTAPSQLQILAKCSGMAPGTYTGSATVTAPGAEHSPAIISVTAVVGSTSSPSLSVSPTSLSFSMNSGGSSPSPQTVSLNSSKPTSVSWTAQADQSWLSVSPVSGALPAQVSVRVDGSGLNAGTYRGTVRITASGLSGSPASVSVTLVVNSSGLPSLNVSPTSLSFSMTSGGASPPAQNLSISSSQTSSATWSAQKDQSWISLSPTSGSFPGQLSVQVNGTGLAAGTYQGTVRITASGLSGSPASVPVTLVVGSASGADEFYVSPTGSKSGTGTISDPWDLATALAHPPQVKPGATIWLRGGTYQGTFHSTLVGSADKPIIVRQYPGERAIIDTGLSSSGAGLLTDGSDTWFWGFEIMSSNPTRSTNVSGSDAAPNRVDGVDTFGPRNKFINMIIHDTAQGFGFWSDAVDNEIYGCLIYYNGWNAPDRGHGHGVYSQNKDGKKLIQDNIQFYGFGQGIRAYGSEKAYARNIHFIGNVSFNSGYLAGGPTNHWSNYLVTVGSGAEGIIFDDNHSYHNTNEDGYSQLGWSFSGVEKDIKARNNYFIGGESAVEVWNWNNLTFTGNKMYSKDQFMIIFDTTGSQTTSSYDFDRNTYYGSGLMRFQGSNVDWSNWKRTTGVDANSTYIAGRPTGTWITVRPNLYEPGRANIVIYNWDSKPSVSVDVSGVLRSGQQYEVRDAMNFFGAPVASGIYGGAPITIPMTGLTIAPPVGQVPFAPKHTAPEFGVFVLLGK